MGAPMRMKNQTRLFFLGVLLLASAFGVPARAGEAEIVVKAGTRAFTPEHLVIKAGDQVIWRNESDEDHFLSSVGPASGPPVTGTQNLMIHQLMHTGDTYTFTFAQAETYYYFCAIHLDMWGRIVVEK